MRSVSLCGSYRFLQEMNDTVLFLTSSGITCLWPKGTELPNPKEMTADETYTALFDYLGNIDESDSLYVFNRDGYLGKSMLVDIGYAYAKRKPVYCLEPVEDEFLKHLITAVVSPAELPTILSK